jgi:hypothetical protein
VAVRIDEAGEKTFAVQIDTFGACGYRLHYLGEIAHGDDLVAANRNCLGIRILRVAGEDFGMKENMLIGAFLRPKRGSRVKEKECCNEQKNEGTPQDSSHEITLSEGQCCVGSTRQNHSLYTNAAGEF